MKVGFQQYMYNEVHRTVQYDVYIPSETEQLSVILISANISKELVLVLYMSYEC